MSNLNFRECKNNSRIQGVKINKINKQAAYINKLQYNTVKTHDAKVDVHKAP